MARLQSSVGNYPKLVHSLDMKKGRSDKPLSWVRKVLILELNDFAHAFVEWSIK